jgi:transcriptional regulator with XRE-family HTH domain
MSNITKFKSWMDQRGLSASDVAKSLGTEEQTIRKWRSQGVPERRRPHVERYMAEWIDPSAEEQKTQDTSVLRIEFTDSEMDEVSEASNIVRTPVREFIRRSAIHQARHEKEKESEKQKRESNQPLSMVAEEPQTGNNAPHAGNGGPVIYPSKKRGIPKSVDKEKEA